MTTTHMTRVLSAAILALTLSGCMMKTKILDAGAVSMTHTSLKDGERLQEKGPVTGQFCTDTMNDKGNIGLMDEAIKAAQKDGNVDFITNAVFYRTGQGCVTVEGTGHKIVAGNTVTAPSAPETKHTTTPAKTKKR